MSLKEYLFKPKWQHKDPAIRATAVAEEEDAALLAALPGICLNDADAPVRLAAARRLRDLPVLLTALERARESEERSALQGRIRLLAASTGPDRPPLADRLRAVQSSSDRELFEAVARQAPEPELRIAALGRVERQGLLGDIASGDVDPEVRRSAAERIEQESTLVRVIDATRKSDKNLHQALEERLHRARLEAGDREAVAREALSICEALEQVPPPHAARLAELERAWQGIQAKGPPNSLAHRYTAVLERLAQPAEPDISPATDAVRKEPAAAPPEAAGEAAAATPIEAAEISDEAPATSEATTAKTPPPAPPAADLDALRQQVEALQALLDGGELHQALVLRAEILEAGKTAADKRGWKSLSGRINRMQGRLRELRDWQHWANNKVRSRLVRELEALSASDLHPDAVLARIKELQQQWKKLEQDEQIPGDRHFAAPPRLWRQFQAAGNAAFEHAKPFLDKRSEWQRERLDEMRELCTQLDALRATEPVDWETLRKTAGQAGGALRRMGDIPAKARKKMVRVLRRSLDAANALLREHEQEVEKVKLKLVRAAAQLQYVEDRGEAIATAKSLQAEWKAAGSLRRGLEQKLWRAFREPIDPLFEEQRSATEAEREAQRELLAEQARLVEELEAILSHADGELAALQGKVQGLHDAWQEVAQPAPRHKQAFQKGLEGYRKRLRQHAEAGARDLRRRCWHKAELLHQLQREALAGPLEAERLAEARADWPVGTDTDPIEQALDKGLEQLADGAAPAGDGSVTELEERLERARLLCIQLEFLAGLPSPEADRELRMQYQVDRLSKTLGGQQVRLSAADEAQQAEREWLLASALPEPQYGAFRSRVKAALSELELEI